MDVEDNNREVKPSQSPHATSTPKNKIISVAGRKGIREDSIISPVVATNESPKPGTAEWRSPRRRKSNDSLSKDEDDRLSIEDQEDDSTATNKESSCSNRDRNESAQDSKVKPNLRNRKAETSDDVDKSVPETPKRFPKHIETPPSQYAADHRPGVAIIGVAFAILLGVLIFFFVSEDEPVIKDIRLIKEKFPLQHDDFWLYVESGIDDVVHLNRPSTFIFLYKKETEGKMKEFLKEIAEYAVYTLMNNNTFSPIEVNGILFSEPEIVKDYGKIIAMYKQPLLDKGVMVVKGLEKVPGISAQAFHSFCDEVNPLVPRAVFLFTMEVDEITVNPTIYAEKQLRALWSELKDDVFYPLFTRMSSIVLTVE